MRNLLLLLMMISGLWCCQKEDSITPELKLEDLYAVKNNASDPVQQRVYDIYDHYKVTVVFNDTVGKVFVKTDVYGDSVFTYERIDPAYSFTGYKRRFPCKNSGYKSSRTFIVGFCQSRCKRNSNNPFNVWTDVINKK